MPDKPTPATPAPDAERAARIDKIRKALIRKQEEGDLAKRVADLEARVKALEESQAAPPATPEQAPPMIQASAAVKKDGETAPQNEMIALLAQKNALEDAIRMKVQKGRGAASPDGGVNISPAIKTAVEALAAAERGEMSGKDARETIVKALTR